MLLQPAAPQSETVSSEHCISVLAECQPGKPDRLSQDHPAFWYLDMEQPALAETPRSITLKDVRSNPKVRRLIDGANEVMRSMGYTEHGHRHVGVVSSITRDGKPVFRDLRWGVYVTFAADSDYVRRCFNEYGIVTDESGNYAAMYKPYHLIGLELGISIASVGLRGEPTGAPTGFRADAVAVAKRDLAAGSMLDGEGGYTVYGRLTPAADSLALGALPIGLAHGVRVTRALTRGQTVTWDAVEAPDSEAVRTRREMERLFSSGSGLTDKIEEPALLRSS